MPSGRCAKGLARYQGVVYRNCVRAACAVQAHVGLEPAALTCSFCNASSMRPEASFSFPKYSICSVRCFRFCSAVSLITAFVLFAQSIATLGLANWPVGEGVALVGERDAVGTAVGVFANDVLAALDRPVGCPVECR